MSEDMKMEILNANKNGFSPEIIALSLGVSEDEVKLTIDAEVNKNDT